MNSNDHSDPISPRLIIRAQLADRAALEELLTLTAPWLRRFLRSMLGDTDADDAAQDVLLIVARRLPLLDEPRAYRTWVYRVASRHALRMLKKRRRAVPLDESLLPASDAPIAVDRDELTLIRAKINTLSPNTRAVIVLHYDEDLSIARVADVLGIPEGTAKSRLAAGLSALRRALSQEPP